MSTKGSAARSTKPAATAEPGTGAVSSEDQAQDLSGFDGGEVVDLKPVPAGTRNVTLSIRLSPEELRILGQRAESAGMKLTAYIRDAALRAEAPPVEDDLLDTAAEVVDLVAALRSSVEAAMARRSRTGTGPGPAEATA